MRNLGKKVFAGFGQKHARWIRKMLATDEMRDGGAAQHKARRQAKTLIK
jgi:hypothetical protein